MKILSILGTRPEAIKMAPVIKELEKYPQEVDSLICVTGQHRQMLDQVLELFDIHPDMDLHLMQPNQRLAVLTARLFETLDGVLEETRPDWILAQGDTTTVFVSAVMAYYHDIRFGHVEAGLRTLDKRRPFPEEMNRRLADAATDAWFAPTERARRALLAEGFPEADIHVTGNTIVDALLEISQRPFDWQKSALCAIPQEGRMVLITAHRRESFGEPFRELCQAIRELAGSFPDTRFIYPVHLNPNVRRPVGEILHGLGNVHLIEPVDYLTLVHLMKRSALVLTDSGGIQEEAPTFAVPVLVMRDTTERPEGVEAGVARLVGTSRERIVLGAAKVLEEGSWISPTRSFINPYGDGRAARRIVEIVLGAKVS
ncbi:MAG TPA: UDP-N-acetylglucosamine 2-epimerase (non-hydrolyzing) [bacterium]|nr:UDP-N-acetylglucosamine 2-epimerase (non-hydrolyzing) [bacterium]HQI47985.1 UDP-N-acetylglucosamine 2-epimerase (non-hydrolyzing) [bacterium]HQJ65614.1 UDP-N-acetylglucosamine 2-epimerase (non-hydrolyzing) [bacterium]